MAYETRAARSLDHSIDSKVAEARSLTALADVLNMGNTDRTIFRIVGIIDKIDQGVKNRMPRAELDALIKTIPQGNDGIQEKVRALAYGTDETIISVLPKQSTVLAHAMDDRTVADMSPLFTTVRGKGSKAA